MKNVLKTSLAIVFFLISTALFAFPNPDDAVPNDINPTDAPIGQYLFWIAVVAMIFVFCTLNKKATEQKIIH